MKRTVVLIGIVSSLVLLSSCYVTSVRPTGTISINLGAPAGRAIDPTAQVRVYLYTYNSSTSYGLYTFPSGKQYVEFPYGSGTQTLAGIPIGLWQVLVSVGSDGPSGTEAFYADGYGASPVISVAGGANSSTSISTQPTPIAYSTALAGKDLKSIVYDYRYSVYSDYPALFTATSSALYRIEPSMSSGTVDLTTDEPFSVTELPSGVRINSLSQAVWQNLTGAPPYCVYINSNQGIIPFSYSILTATGNLMNTSYSATLTDSEGNRLDVLDAAAAFNSGGDVVVYYRRANDFGGVYLTPNSYFPFDGTRGAPWVKGIRPPGSTNEVSILAMAMDSYSAPNGFAYFATTAGAFRAPASLVANPSSGSTVSFAAPDNELIQAVAVDCEENLIYIGTPKGAYYATLNESSPTSVITGGWMSIPATTGDSIISIKLDNSASYRGESKAVAIRSRYNLYTLSGPPSLGPVVTIYPFYAGLPGELNAMDFANGTLFLAGSWGLASVFVTNVVVPS